jgi:hypothetical protein
VGEKETESFQFTFDGFLKVAFQGSRVASGAGLILVRELDERSGLEKFIAEHLSDSRQGLNTRFRLTDLLRQSVYSRLAGFEDLNDAALRSHRRCIGSRPSCWSAARDRGSPGEETAQHRRAVREMARTSCRLPHFDLGVAGS